MSAGEMHFRNVGGSRQLVLENAAQLEHVLTLDPALWAVDVLPVDAVLIDLEFLEFLDSDCNGRIRPDELRSAIRWTLDMLQDRDGINRQSDTLKISALNLKNPEGLALFKSANRILENLEISGPETITLAQVRDKKTILAAANQNGDGVIIPMDYLGDKINTLIRNIMTACGSVKDISGEAGIDAKTFETFLSEGASELDWRKRGAENFSALPYGESAEKFYKKFIDLKDQLDRFFLVSAGLTEGDRFDFAAKVDPLDSEAVMKFLQNAPAATPSPCGKLSVSGWINPLWKERIGSFLKDAFTLKAIAVETELTEKEWQKISSEFAWHTSWLKEKTSPRFDFLSTEELAESLNPERTDAIRKILAEDAAIAAEISACDHLRKLLLFQKYLLDFTNNFVCLDRLFNPAALSIIQPGILILDSRHFTLASKVRDIAEHKRIVVKSNICVLYAEMTRGKAPNMVKMTLAVAVTSGTMQNIFVGQSGVFIGYDGLEWDAKVIDLVQQPVSFYEAIRMPFMRCGEFMGKQADKFFSSKGKVFTDNIGQSISSGKLPSVVLDGQNNRQTPAVSGSMLLMGGGVGIAAIGSAFAFMANTLKNISVWNVVTVFVILALVISGPVLLVSIVKLMNRSVSYFLAAGGWAVNSRMLLSRKMGLLFTQKPAYPDAVRFLKGDLAERLAKEISRRSVPAGNSARKVFAIFILLVIAFLIYFFFFATAR